VRIRNVRWQFGQLISMWVLTGCFSGVAGEQIHRANARRFSC
jgi:hypothetical protein